jgi:hypothetical protein
MTVANATFLPFFFQLLAMLITSISSESIIHSFMYYRPWCISIKIG